MRTCRWVLESILAVLVVAVIGQVSQAGTSKYIEQFSKATDLFVAQRYEEALPHARKAVKELETSAMAQGLLGHILLNLGENREAERTLRKALSLERGSSVPGIYVALAMSILKEQQTHSDVLSPDELKRTEEALEFIEKSPPEEQSYSETLQLRGEALARLGRSYEAIGPYETLFKRASINFRRSATGPLFRLYARGSDVGDALARLKRFARQAGVAPLSAVSSAYSGVYLRGDHDLARDLLMAHVKTLDAKSPVSGMIEKGDLCDEGALDRYFASDPPAEDGLVMGGLVLVTMCHDSGAEDGSMAPVRKKQVNPSYPELARVGRMEAVVLLRATIEKDGKPSKVWAMPNPTLELQLGFEDAAVEAVRQWRYKPAVREGKPAAETITIIIEFKLT